MKFSPPPQLRVCVSLNGSMVDASCLYSSVGSVDGAASARPVLRAPGSSKPNGVMGKPQGKAARLASERKQTVVAAGMGDNYLRLRQRSGPFALLGKEETDRHEELLDAAAEFLFILPSRGKGKQPSRLNYILKNVFLCLEKNIMLES